MNSPALTRKGAMKMALTARSVEYYYTRLEDGPSSAYMILSQLASEEISLLAFSAVPFGNTSVELTLFPDRADSLLSAAEKHGWVLIGPQHAILIQGDDHLGALAEIHRNLQAAGVKIYASTGVTDGAGRYGYVIYFREGDHLAAANALSQ
jgi:hypothetical protein